jgi:hypothetical protein
VQEAAHRVGRHQRHIDADQVEVGALPLHADLDDLEELAEGVCLQFDLDVRIAGLEGVDHLLHVIGPLFAQGNEFHRDRFLAGGR